jgi:hypothetical protein
MSCSSSSSRVNSSSGFIHSSLSLRNLLRLRNKKRKQQSAASSTTTTSLLSEVAFAAAVGVVTPPECPETTTTTNSTRSAKRSTKRCNKHLASVLDEALSLIVLGTNSTHDSGENDHDNSNNEDPLLEVAAEQGEGLLDNGKSV